MSNRLTITTQSTTLTLSTAGGGSGVSDHGALTGLGDDDHTQYLRADGTRALSGNLSVSAGATIDGRDLSVDGAKLDGIESGATADQSAAEVPFTPAGGVAATDVQAAIVEVAGDASVASSAAATAQSTADTHIARTDNPHGVTAVQAGAASLEHGADHLPGGSDAIPPSTPITESTTARVLADSDHGRVILCTHASGCAVTVPGTLTPGFTCLLVQRGGQITATGSGGLTMTPPAAFVAKTAEAGSAMAVLVESATVGNAIGDLEAAP